MIFLQSSVAEPAGNQDAVSLTKAAPRGFVFFLIPSVFEMAGFNPVNDEFSVDRHGGMLQALDDGQISIGEVGVLADHGNVDFFGKRVKVVGHRFPLVQHPGG